MIFREATKKEVINALESSILGKHSFLIEFPEQGVKPIRDYLKISYIGDGTFYFKASETLSPNEKKFVFELRCSPGIYLRRENAIVVDSFSELIQELKSWVSRVIDDLKDTSPLLNNVYEEIHKLEEEFEKKLNEKFDATDKSYFTQAEVQELKDKIDSLFSKFEQLKEEHEIKDSELKAIKAELDKIKSTLPILPKTTWFKSNGKKVISLMGKYLNPDTVKSIATEVVKGLLNDKM